MIQNKNFFARALDAMVESRKRQAEYELARYRQMFELETPKVGR